jgi:predicted 3-demethylubiquinone-9 3-methyltransferase (glyoxalase superfamily)
MPNVTPFLWYDDNAEEAVEHYRSVFGDVKVLETTRYGDAGPGTPGSVMTISFEVAGQRLTALNGGPLFSFTEAISLQVDVDGGQGEVDRLWNGLADGGTESQCGWVRDRFGLWWQIVPRELTTLLTDPDPDRAQRAMQAMLKMGKIDIAELEAAAAG